jgi:sugar phosphate isomerase/epimerase
MIVGCNTVLFASLPLPEAIRHIKWAGFEGVELACLGGARHVWPDMDDAAIERVKVEVAEAGLELTAIEATANLADAERRAWFYAALELAQKLGVPVVSTGSGGKSTPEDLAAVLTVLPEVAAEAERRQVRVSVKAHVNAAVHNVETALQAAAAADSPWLGVNYDATHLAREGEDILEAWDRLAPHVLHIHFRDMQGGSRQIGPPYHQIPGLGVLDLPGLLARIVRSGYEGALDLEVIGAFKFPPGESMGIAAQARGYIRRCLEEIAGRS